MWILSAVLLAAATGASTGMIDGATGAGLLSVLSGFKLDCVCVCVRGAGGRATTTFRLICMYVRYSDNMAPNSF